MPYYPKNRIITNLYTSGGEYIIIKTGLPYIGYYYSLYNGTYFTGRNQNDGVSQELIKYELKTDVSQDSLVVTITNADDLQADDYLRIVGGSPNDKKLPTPYYPKPTLQDYELGEFQRYFAKQINDLIFIEINKNTYDKLLQNNTEYYWELYYVVSIPWELRGEKNKVEQINRNIVALAELDYSLPGFSYYIQLSGGFLQFYKYAEISNLYTAGGEFKTADGQNYVGDYHIHDSKGPMVGKTHTKELHGNLFPINKSITPRAINQQTNINPNQSPSSDNPTPMNMGGGNSGGGGGGY